MYFLSSKLLQAVAKLVFLTVVMLAALSLLSSLIMATPALRITYSSICLLYASLRLLMAANAACCHSELIIELSCGTVVLVT